MGSWYRSIHPDHLDRLGRGDGRIRHAVLYIGNGRMIEARFGQRITRKSDPHWWRLRRRNTSRELTETSTSQPVSGQMWGPWVVALLVRVIGAVVDSASRTAVADVRQAGRPRSGSVARISSEPSLTADRARSEWARIVAYRLDIDPIAQEQIRALAPKGLAALVDALDVRSLVPSEANRSTQQIRPAVSTSCCSVRAAISSRTRCCRTNSVLPCSCCLGMVRRALDPEWSSVMIDKICLTKMVPAVAAHPWRRHFDLVWYARR